MRSPYKQKDKKAAFLLARDNNFFRIIYLFLISQVSLAQSVTQNFTVNTTVTVPIGVTSLKVECWGGGGKGSTMSNIINIGGGGGGGAYVSSQLCVKPGETYSVVVGAGGSGATPNGGDTYFGSVSTVMAKGGNGLVDNTFTAGSGGLASASVGQIKYSGGNGSPRSEYRIIAALAYRSGAGGGAAGSSGSGNNAVEVVPGAAKADNGGKGGDGADGGLLNLLGGFNGNSGSVYGAGGSGAARGALFSSASYIGGSGAPGLVRITYEAYACNVSSETTWNGTSWSNGTPEACKKAIINADYNTTTNGSFESCACQIATGKKLTVGNGVNNDYITIYNQLENSGTVVINNNASLLQHYSVKNNAGNISVHRHSRPMYRYDYTYWSSPVTFDSNYTLHDLSPATQADKYFYWNAISQSWDGVANGAEVMYPGKGYIIRAPQTFSTNPMQPTVYSDGVFNGKPNNGDVSYNIVGNNAADPSFHKWNLLGNPYPSAIDIEKFLTANSTKLDGTVYLWTHNTPRNAIRTYTAADYAVYNFTGSVGTGDMINVPTKYLASGQSFFVRGISSGSASITFNNEMRVSNFNNQFFMLQSPLARDNSNNENRIWLNLTNDQGAFNQTLVGYVQGATDDLDWGYDGDLFGGNYVTFYSLLDERKLSIQGRAVPFDNQDSVKLGYRSTLEGILTINIADSEGQLTSEPVFLEDKLLDVVHNLRESDYSFETVPGTFDDRFALRYSDQFLGIETVKNLENFTAYKNENQHLVINTERSAIKKVSVFDISGRLLHEENVGGKKRKVIETLPVTNQVLLISIITQEEKKFTKKIVY